MVTVVVKSFFYTKDSLVVIIEVFEALLTLLNSSVLSPELCTTTDLASQESFTVLV